ncbi:hypothetical protein PCA10_46830 [Metapseudomonas resinovorans NBRC 106553]|uniref:Uncharacterized protein n=1 Tax=Metapseudomonas resinovorans NBRC 106553 TaxID=1245471 RepID=S6AN84_METRE|nr:hypothetical protein PCA10_46830 [Pseudomonas resinovorans NBRC 106553]
MRLSYAKPNTCRTPSLGFAALCPTYALARQFRWQALFGALLCVGGAVATVYVLKATGLMQ